MWPTAGMAEIYRYRVLLRKWFSENKKLRHKKQTGRKKAWQFILLLVLIIIIWGVVGVWIGVTLNNYGNERGHAISARNFQKAISITNSMDPLRKISVLWFFIPEDAYNSDWVFPYLKGMTENNGAEILSAIDRDLSSGKSPEGIFGSFANLIFEPYKERNSSQNITLPEMMQMWILYKDAFDKLYRVPPVDNAVSSIKQWSYQFAEDRMPDSFAANSSGKVLVVNRNNKLVKDNNEIFWVPSSYMIDFTGSLMLPRHYSPENLSEVEYIVLVDSKYKAAGTYSVTGMSPGGTVGYQMYDEITLVRAKDMSVIKEYGMIDGERPVKITEKNPYGNPPSCRDVYKVIETVVADIREGILA